MKIQTELSCEDYKRFKQKAKDLKTSEYKLAQDAILVFINEFDKSQRKSALQRLVDFVREDIDKTF